MSARPSGVVAGSPPLPQVNLLPPEIRASRSLRVVKRVLLLVVVAALLVSGGGYVLAGQHLATAERELDDARAETQRLLVAQREFSEVPVVLGQLERATDARVFGMSTEILWEPLLSAVMETRPSGTVFTEIVMTGATPMAGTPGPMHPLQAPSVATINFTGKALTLPDAAAWVAALNSVEHLQDAYVSFTDITMGSEGALLDITHYDVEGSVQVSAEAFAERFVETPEGED